MSGRGFAVVLVAGLALTACGGGSSSAAHSAAPSTAASPSPSAMASPSATASPSASPEPSDSPTDTPSETASDSPSDTPSPSDSGGGAAAGAGGGTVPAVGTTGTYTAPSAKLKIGQKALVPFVNNKVGGTIGVTVTGVTTGTPADLAQLDLGDRVAGMTPYYVHFTVSNESGTDFAFTSLDLSEGIYADGTEAQRVSIIGDFAPCPDSNAGPNFKAKGSTFTACVIGLAAGTAKVTGGEYQGSSYGDVIPNAPDYGTKPITWQP